MADLSDITAYLAVQAAAAVYPNGAGNPSIAPVLPGFGAPADVRIYEGWPEPAQLDLDVAGQTLSGTPPTPTPRAKGPVVNVSVFPMVGGTAVPFQVQDHTYVVTPPLLGMSVSSIVGPLITVAGQPNAQEYLTVVADRRFIYSTTGASTAAILAALATAAAANYSGVSSTATTLTIPYQYQIEVRVGGVATLGIATWRQRQAVMVTVWAPTHAARNVVAAGVDEFLKRTITAAMPDTSIAKFCYQRTNTVDEQQQVTIYRRDLIYEVEYATVHQFPGYLVTASTQQVAGGNWGIDTQTPPTLSCIS